MSSSTRYPLGKFNTPEEITSTLLSHWILQLERLPIEYERKCRSLTESDLKLTYRNGSWNIRQIVHHVADSHMNGLIRVKWALTEEQPTIKAYNEKKWTLLPDATDLPIEVSLELIKSVHNRWVYLLRNLENNQLKQTFTHPESLAVTSIDEHAGQYAWHGSHHLAHIDLALKNHH